MTTAFDIYEAALNNADINGAEAFDENYLVEYADAAMGISISTELAERIIRAHENYQRSEPCSNNWDHILQGPLSALTAGVDPLDPESLQTSQEICDAIHGLATDSRTPMEIWEAPTDAELVAIIEIVTKNGLEDPEDFCWGAAGEKWAEIGV